MFIELNRGVKLLKCGKRNFFQFVENKNTFNEKNFSRLYFLAIYS
jgi:hypothetical protein